MSEYAPLWINLARWLDSRLWVILETATGLLIPRQDQGLGWECVLPIPVQGRGGRSFQEWVVRLPVRLGGFGLRSLEETAGVAFLGALEQSVPSFPGPQGICPALEQEMGGLDCFGEGAPEETRWAVMLRSGCREGVELSHVWRSLQQEEQDSARWLGVEVQNAISKEVEGMGEGSVNGSTRGLVVKERDTTRGRLIKKALEVHPNQARVSRPVWAWLQRDKLSSAWLQALPGPDSSLTNAEFSEAAAAMLCLPSPACQEKLGQTIKGRVVVDLHGDQVQSTDLPGDHWTTRHNRIKLKLFGLCQWAGISCEMEVFNLFSGSIPQAGLSRMERGRKVQSLVPDLRVGLVVEGNPVMSLHELKVISSSKTRYKPRRQGQEAIKAVEKRAGQLHQEYVKKARSTDTKYCGTLAGVTGPVETKLVTMGHVEGLVFGAFGEASVATHNLINHLATSRVQVAGPQRGRQGHFRAEKTEVGLITAFLHRTLSVAAVKAQAFSLLGRLEVLGQGAAAAARRQTIALQQEWR